MASWREHLQAAAGALWAGPEAAPAPLFPQHVDHADAAPVSTDNPRADNSVYNLITGLGGQLDKGAANRPRCNWTPLSDGELWSTYANDGLGARVVNLLPTAATRKGWTVDVEDASGNRDTNVTLLEDERLHLWSQLRWAWVWARLWRYSVVLMVTQDDIPAEFEGKTGRAGWLAQPLDPERVQKVYALQVYDCFEARPLAYNGNLRDPDNYRAPSLWQITPAMPGFVEGGDPSMVVHGSRVLYLRGAQRAPTLQQGEWGQWRGRGVRTWGETAPGPDDSVLRSLWGALGRLSQIDSAGAHIAQELREAVFKIGGWDALATGSQKDKVQEKLSMMSLARTLLGATIIGQNDDYRNEAHPPTGYGELSTGAQAALAAHTGYPLSKLFGFAPSGLSTDDASGERNWSELVSGEQMFSLGPPLRKAYRVILAADDGPADLDGSQEVRLHLKFNPLDVPTEREIADTRYVNAQSDALYFDRGLVTDQQIQDGRFGEGGYQTDLPAAKPLDLEEEDPEVLLPTGIPSGIPSSEDIVLNGAQFREAINLAVQVARGNSPRANAVAAIAGLLKRPVELVEQMVPAEGSAPNAMLSTAAPENHADAAVDLTPTKAMQEEAARGVAWVEEGHGGDGLKPATIQWARRIAKGEALSEDKVRKMRAWLARHKTDKQGEGFSPGEKGFPSPGRVAWALWAGDPAVTWSERKVAALDRERARTDGACQMGITHKGDTDHIHLITPGASITEPGPDGHTHSVKPGATETGPGGEDRHTHPIRISATPPMEWEEPEETEETDEQPPGAGLS